MDELVKAVLAAPIANLFIVGGLIFLGIAVVGKISGKIEPGKTGRIASGVLGSIFLVVGLAMHLRPMPTPEPQRGNAPVITDVKIREDTSSGLLVIHQDVFFTDLDGDAYKIDWQVVSTTAKSIEVYDGTIEASSEQQKAGTFLTASWNCGTDSYTVTLRGIIFDRANNRSKPIEYILNCH